MEIDLNGLWLGQMNQVLNVVQAQQKTIAHNIANCNTPGYSRQEIAFQDALQSALADPAPAMTGAEIPVERDLVSPVRQDGNNVSVEREMVDLAQNTQMYTSLSKMIAKHIALARFVITGGRP